IGAERYCVAGYRTTLKLRSVTVSVVVAAIWPWKASRMVYDSESYAFSTPTAPPPTPPERTTPRAPPPDDAKTRRGRIRFGKRRLPRVGPGPGGAGRPGA